MKKSNLCLRCAVIVVAAFTLQSAAVFADEAMPMKSGMMGEHGDRQDWAQHTKKTLDDLKAKLHLRADQTGAWDAWSHGVLKDAEQQLDGNVAKHKGDEHKEMAEMDETTPERMAHHIARLRADTAWMQEHLVQLDAALVRTKTFYEALDVNQRTIFDLYWQEMHGRSAGGMHGSDHESCPMMKQHK